MTVEALDGMDGLSGAVDDPGVAAPKHEPVPHGKQPEAPRDVAEPVAPAEEHGGTIVCPVAGTVVKLLVGVGDRVALDEPVAIVEALKVESRVLSPHAGVVKALLVETGQRVSAGDALVRL